MERRLLMLISSISLILMATAMAAPSDDTGHAKIDPALDERLGNEQSEKIPIIVMLKDKEVPDLSGMDVRYKYSLINGVAGGATPSTIKRLSESDSVEGIYLDGSTHVSAPAAGASGSQVLSPAVYVNADKLWTKGIDGKGVTVAVIDSGIDKNHPDLEGKVVGEKNFVDAEVSADDLLGHGTMVAGIIAGSGAASGGKYKGIAPGANLLNVKVIDSNGDGKISDIIAGIEWAIYNGADILTLSLGGLNLGETNPPITKAADNAMDEGIVVCVAAGNRNSTTLQSMTETGASSQANPGNVSISQIAPSQVGRNSNKNVLLLVVPIVLALPPGLIDSPGDGIKVITVGASDYEGHVANFSGSGPTRDGRTKPDVVGPGVDVISAVPPGLERPEYLDIYYAKESGTSLSTPVAAGVAALLLQAQKNMTPAGVKAALTNGATSLNNTLGERYEDYYQGSGLIDANKSYQILSDDLCGVEPGRWVPGRWAYLPAGKGIYVGLNAGADRPQKKLYALAPGDEDWATEMTFFTNKELTNLATSVSGPIADWASIQPLPRSIPANGQRVFGAAITVPNGTLPGFYNGSIDILEGSKELISIPVTVDVAGPIEILKGTGLVADSIKGSDWRYYYLDVPAGTSDLKAMLRWKSTNNIDLFLLAPTSEYYSGNQNGNLEDIDIQGPPSGRWLLAVHGEMLPSAQNYTLSIERSLIESFPKRWNVMTISPGASTNAEFKVENRGPPLDNLSYKSLIENITVSDLNGSVGAKAIWERNIEIQPGTRRISARLSNEDNSSELLFLFEDPHGEPADAVLGTEDLGPIEVLKPQTGIWKIRVYGYDVPSEEQPFNIRLTQYADEPWTWITTNGTKNIDSDSSATIKASIAVPKNTSIHSLDGYIEVDSADTNRSIQIPVSVTVFGPYIEGLTYTGVEDADKDGYFDRLFLGFGVNATAPGSYRLMGSLVDCAGNSIEQLDSRAKLNGSGVIKAIVNGSKIWKSGKCMPLQIENLLLYSDRGELLDRYKGNITLNRSPKEFQPPAAYLTGEFVNDTAAGMIKIGVAVNVVRPGSYQVSGTLVNDNGDEMGKDTVPVKLATGNATIFLEFNPTKFAMMGKSSRLHLVDLKLTLDGTELDGMDKAWDSGLMDPKGLLPTSMTAASTDTANASGTIKRENGKVVIS
jgi:subtilisin family serine protease